MIAALRKRRGLSMSAFAEQSRLPVAVLADIESGEIPVDWSVAKFVGPPLGRTPLSLLTANLFRSVKEEDVDGAIHAIIEIAKASGYPEHLTPTDKRDLALLEPAYRNLKNTAGEPLSIAAVRKMFTPQPADGGYMPVRPVGNGLATDPDPMNSGFMPVRPIDA